MTDPLALRKLLNAEYWILTSIREVEDKLLVHKDTDMAGYYTRRLDSFKHELALVQEKIKEMKNVSV